MGAPPVGTYLVETYVGGLDGPRAADFDRRMRAAAESVTEAQDAPVVWRGSLAILAEETYSSIVAADDTDPVRAVCAAASLRCDHIVEIWPSCATPT